MPFTVLRGTLPFVVLLAMPSATFALSLPSYGLTSLLRMAEIVVEVERPVVIDAKRSTARCRTKVLRVYKGNVEEGDVLTVSTYPYEPVRGVQRLTNPSETLVLFLKWRPESGLFVPAPTGVKIVRGNTILRFAQVGSSFNPLEPVPHGPELIELPKGAKYDRKAFDADLAAATERVEAFEEAVRKADHEAIATYISRFNPNARPRYSSLNLVDGHLEQAAARWLAEKAEPEFLFELLAPRPDGKDFGESSRFELELGFGTRRDLAYLWTVAESRQPATARVRALDLLGKNEQGKDVPWEAFASDEACEAGERAFELRSCRRALAIATTAKDPAVRRAAAEVVVAWHPQCPRTFWRDGERQTSPVVPLDDPIMLELRAAIEAESDEETRAALIDGYRWLGQLEQAADSRE